MADEPFLPIRTERAVLRAFTPADAPALAAYRNDPGTAEYQDWDLPFTTDNATALITGQLHLDGPTAEEWYQIAIEADGELAGDVAVGLGEKGLLAMIGYTLAPHTRGQGLATEAVAAVVDRLFDVYGAHRVAATLDPRNIDSARVLDRLGFRYEGCAPGAAHVRGEWYDDDRYAILRDERRAWRDRPREPVRDIRLVEVTRENLGRVERLATHHSERRFVSPMAQTFADALVPDVIGGTPVVPWFRAVEADGELAAFVMIAESTATHPEPYLWRLLVDRHYQRRGIGGRIVALVVDKLLAEGRSTLRTSWGVGRGSPEPFYLRLGFVPTGEIDDDEIVARLDLSRFARA